MGKKKKAKSKSAAVKKVAPSRTMARKRRRLGKQGKGRYWIEDCKESATEATEATISVVISRVDLDDDHTHGLVARNAEGVSNDLPSGEDATTKTNVVVQKTKANTLPDDVDSKADNHAEDESQDSNNNNSDGNNTKSSGGDANDKRKRISIVRSLSAQLPLPIKFLSSSKMSRLPNGDCGDGIVNPHPKSTVADKYWAQRKRLFSRYDSGIQLDKESWYSVTPEAIAKHHAERVIRSSAARDGLVVLDAFCGCGGNAIAFASRTEISLVVCVDKDRNKLKLAASNAAVYDIPKEKMVFVLGDACFLLANRANDDKKVAPQQEEKPDADENDAMTSMEAEMHGYKLLGGLDHVPTKIDVVFLSPPWGGMDYESIGRRCYGLVNHIKLVTEDGSIWTGEQLLEASLAVASNQVVYFLPRNTNGMYVAKSALKVGYTGSIELEQNVLQTKLKTVTAYFDARKGVSRISPGGIQNR